MNNENLKNKLSKTQLEEIQNHLKNIKDIKTEGVSYTYSFINQTIVLLKNILPDQTTMISVIYYPYFKLKLLNEEEIFHFTQNKDVITILEILLKIEKLKINTKEATLNSVREMFIVLSSDLRAIILKLTIELTKISNLNIFSKEEGAQLMSLCKEIFSPIASMLGLSFIKNEMENKIFKYYKPKQYTKLTSSLKDYVNLRKKQINLTIRRITKIAKDSNIPVAVKGRQKEIHSIYKKMKSNKKGLNQILDILGVRILVHSVEECYYMLGKVHGIYAPMERFKDYIAQPKQNGYQSLHTTVLVENGDPLEVQIRTFKMHEYAEYGFASHVAYKEKRKIPNDDTKLNYIRSILDMYKTSSSEDLFNVLKNDVYSDLIFIQTPKGKILQFLDGSIPIDFAYRIHSKVGEQCVGAKVNGKLVPLTTKLQNGDVVEIITSAKSKGPSRDWVKKVRMPSTIKKINTFFKKDIKDENIEKGKLTLELYIKNKNIGLKKFYNKKNLEILFTALNCDNLNDVYYAIGNAGLSVGGSIIYKIVEQEDIEKPKPQEVITTSKKTKNVGTNKVSVLGFSDLLTKFASCCNPIPGDNIIGYVSRGKGVTIHRENCGALLSCDDERLVSSTWNINISDSFTGALTVICVNQPNVLAQISKRISDMKINISTLYVKPLNELQSKVDIVLEVASKQELDEVVKKLSSLSIVEDVKRRV